MDIPQSGVAGWDALQRFVNGFRPGKVGKRWVL